MLHRYFILDDRHKIMAKRIRTAEEMIGIMKCFPGATFQIVDARTYEYMHIGDRW